MELDRTEAARILSAHNIEIYGRDPRTIMEIATHYMLNGTAALPDDYAPPDSVARIKLGLLSWPD